MADVLRRDWPWLLAFMGVNAFDAILTVMLLMDGYVYSELNPIWRNLFITLGTPYSIMPFLIMKMSLALGFGFLLMYLVTKAPRLERAICVIPIMGIGAACIINLGGLL